MLPLFVIMLGAFLVLGMLVFAFTGPSTQRAGDRRIAALRERHGPEDVIASAHMRRIAAVQATKRVLRNFLCSGVITEFITREAEASTSTAG